jgi:ribose 5-phosphate isomerase B
MNETETTHQQKALYIGCDHAAVDLKAVVKNHLEERGIPVTDVGTHSGTSVNYVTFAAKVAGAVSQGVCDRGILICGSGIGMSMAANRFPGVRAALCNDLFSAIMSRRHNNANILALGGRIVGDVLAKEIVDAWLDTDFEGGRHQERIDTMDTIAGGKET